VQSFGGQEIFDEFIPKVWEKKKDPEFMSATLAHSENFPVYFCSFENFSHNKKATFASCIYLLQHWTISKLIFVVYINKSELMVLMLCSLFALLSV
jgi:hypothetical protein